MGRLALAGAGTVFFVCAVAVTVRDITRRDRDHVTFFEAFKSPGWSYWLLVGGCLLCWIGAFGIEAVL